MLLVSILVRLPDPSGSKWMGFAAVLITSSIPETRGGGSDLVSDAYAQLMVRFLLSHSVEQVANVVLYSSDYYTKVVAAEEAQ